MLGHPTQDGNSVEAKKWPPARVRPGCCGGVAADIFLPDAFSASVQSACDASLLPIAHKIETITYETARSSPAHAKIAATLEAQIYFAKPYHSWERGLNEHTNGLLRQYFPKGSDFSTLTPAEVQRVKDKLNSRPRKALGYKTPSEVFFAAA